MIKCLNCNSYKVCLKFKEKQFMLINECLNCYETNYLFIDDYINNYKEFYTATKKETFPDKNNCLKHSKIFLYFCHNCKEILCEDCLKSHDSINHFIQRIKEIIGEKEKNEIFDYKNKLNKLKDIIKKKLGEIDNKNDINKYKIKLFNSLLNIIDIKNLFLEIILRKDDVNAYNLFSLKCIINRNDKVKTNLLIKSIEEGNFPKAKEINEYTKCIYYSFKSITKDKIINNNAHNWVNHIIQLENGNILSANWETLFLYKINRDKKNLDLIKTIRINNGSINHIYEYKRNKILCCDNQMKILQLNEENNSYKILFVADYSRKIIPFIPYIDIEPFHKFLLSATPNGIKLYHYLDDISDSQIEENLVNDIEYLGDFSNGYDYSSIIQVKNKICGIYQNKKISYDSHFVVWETEYDFDVKNYSRNKFNLLGEIKNIGAGIGRYSFSNVNDKYVLIGIMGNYFFYTNKERINNGIKMVSLETIEIVQYFYNGDEIMTINTLNNGMILTGGMNNKERKYFIRQYRYDEKDKEILLVGSLQLHNEFINYIGELNDGVFMSCGRDGNIYLVYS